MSASLPYCFDCHQCHDNDFDCRPGEPVKTLSREGCIDAANHQLPFQGCGPRTYWHPYTQDARDHWVNVTGLNGLAAMRKIGLPGSLHDAFRFDWAIANRKPLNSPSLGCIVHV